MSGPVGIDLSQGAALGVLTIRGVDAARFLQGQLSADIEKLDAGGSTLAGFHNPQGRVIALLVVVRASTEEFFAILPRELAGGVAQRLSKFVLRTKVRIADESAGWRVLGCSSEVNSTASVAIPWGSRRVLILPIDAPFTAGEATRNSWERADIAAGLPQVYAATSEVFVAQMLNLDLLGAISFDKGCYTGQEVIARAHYRGRVKRRLQRWHNLSGTGLAPGQWAQAGDGRTLIVVRVVDDGSGAQELLAVGNYATAGGAEDAGAESAATPRVSGPLTLPYRLPD